jgi:hypothetical protein
VWLERFLKFAVAGLTDFDESAVTRALVPMFASIPLPRGPVAETWLVAGGLLCRAAVPCRARRRRNRPIDAQSLTELLQCSAAPQASA